MSKRKGSGPLLFVVGFFAGVIATICLLVPGKIGPTILVNGDEQVQRQQLDDAGYKVQQFGSDLFKRVNQAIKPTENAQP